MRLIVFDIATDQPLTPPVYSDSGAMSYDYKLKELL